jgi:hypothetical protein
MVTVFLLASVSVPAFGNSAYLPTSCFGEGEPWLKKLILLSNILTGNRKYQLDRPSQ